jgi:uncharacterized membrane protein
MTTMAMERALKLAVVTGMRAALGPAILASAQHRPERKSLALAAMGELVFDKLPLVPDRDTLLPLLARGVAGAWVAKRCLEAEGEEDPWAAPLGAAVAMGVAAAAPRLRRALGWSTGMPQPVLGLIEDYLALKLGTEAVGMPFEALVDVAKESLEEVTGRLEDATCPTEAVPQSAGAGSM